MKIIEESNKPKPMTFNYKDVEFGQVFIDSNDKLSLKTNIGSISLSSGNVTNLSANDQVELVEAYVVFKRL